MSHLKGLINNIKNMVHSEKYLNFKKHFDEGEKFFEMMRFASAYLEYSEALKQIGSDPVCNFKKGLACLQLDKMDEAVTFFSMAYKFNKSFFEAAFELGMISYSRGQKDEASKFFTDCLKIKPSCEKARYMSGRCYLLKGQLEKAEKEFIKGLKISPDDALCNTGLARLLFFSKGDHHGALKCLNSALKKEPGLGEAYYLTAEIHLARRNGRKLAATAEAVKKNKPDGPYADLALAASVIFENKMDEARDLYKKALEAKRCAAPEMLDSLKAAGRFCFISGEYPDGINYYARAIEINGSDQEALAGAADINIQTRNYHEALRVREKVLAAGGHDQLNAALALYILANYYIDLRKTDDTISALKEIDDILENLSRENSPRLKKIAFKSLYLKGRAYFMKNDHSAAAKILEKITTERASEIFTFDREYSAAVEGAQNIISLINSKASEKETEESETQLTRPDHFSALPKNFYSSVKKAHSVFKKIPFFSELALEAADMLEQFARPLNLAVVGEFNTGKSTFINALIGEPVAPMGIEPVTAAINIFRYGAEKKARVIYEDGVEEIDINSLANYIDERRLQKNNDAAIKFVEIFYPAEILKSVNIIDTPGLNAPVAGHEVLTKDFLRDSDAILWIFDVQSAGKMTEKKSLEFISGFSRKTLAIVNKIDTVNESETLEVITALSDEFKSLIDNICPVSAKQALNGIVKKDTEEISESNIDAMLDFLKNEILSDPQTIKNTSVVARFETLICKARKIADEAAAGNEAALEKAEIIFQKAKLKILSYRDNFNKSDAPLIKTQYSKLAEGFVERFREAVTIEKGIIFDSYKLDETDIDFFRKAIIKSVEDMLYSSIKNTILTRIIKFEEDMAAEWEEFLDSAAPAGKYGFIMLLKGHIESQKKIFIDRVVRFNCKYFEGYIAGKLAGLMGEGGQNRSTLGMPSRVIRELVPDITGMVSINFDEWCRGYLQTLKEYCESVKEYFRSDLASVQRTRKAIEAAVKQKS